MALLRLGTPGDRISTAPLLLHLALGVVACGATSTSSADTAQGTNGGGGGGGMDSAGNDNGDNDNDNDNDNDDNDNNDNNDSNDSNDGSDNDSDSDNEGPKFDIGAPDETDDSDHDDDEDCTEADLPVPNAAITGTVFAPNMEIPISGALVYLTDKPVEPVPDGVYCAECIELDCIHYVLTNDDGTFDLPAVAGDGQKLVVQKGQFLHVVDMDVDEGTQAVLPSESNLPGQWDPDAGEWIPRIAVYETSPDEVFNVLAKFGLGEVDATGALVRGTEQFTLLSAFTDAGATIDDLDTMSLYHIIFVPCAATVFWAGAPAVPAARIQNIRDYVAAGGKWYATDHTNEYIAEPFPTYQDFHNPLMPDLQPPFDVEGEVVDADMLAWLEALPDTLKDVGGGNPTLAALPSVTLQQNFSGIDAVHEILVEDDEGEDVNVGHYTWVEGPCTSCTPADIIRPMAISGQYGCGRMMYSTFENSSVAHAGLNPQELVLLYMILEIGVCHKAPPPPPPPESPSGPARTWAGR
ncbi:MAG: carboxypeptidase-like regulatory domain-containing protein [Nannocystaceae bacterium]